MKPFVVSIIFGLMLVAYSRCSPPRITPMLTDDCSGKFVSETFNHFEGGVVFADVESGLDILWRASFRNGRPYRENVGLFVSRGLLILPNKYNTTRSGRLGALPLRMMDNKLFIDHGGDFLEVLAIIHTHPDFKALPMPAPGKDYQYCYLGLHNYIIDNKHLYDAYWDERRTEQFARIGARGEWDDIVLKVFGSDSLTPLD